MMRALAATIIIALAFTACGGDDTTSSPRAGATPDRPPPSASDRLAVYFAQLEVAYKEFDQQMQEAQTATPAAGSRPSHGITDTTTRGLVASIAPQSQFRAALNEMDPPPSGWRAQEQLVVLLDQLTETVDIQIAAPRDISEFEADLLLIDSDLRQACEEFRALAETNAIETSIECAG